MIQDYYEHTPLQLVIYKWHLPLPMCSQSEQRIFLTFEINLIYS